MRFGTFFDLLPSVPISLPFVIGDANTTIDSSLSLQARQPDSPFIYTISNGIINITININIY